MTSHLNEHTKWNWFLVSNKNLLTSFGLYQTIVWECFMINVCDKQFLICLTIEAIFCSNEIETSLMLTERFNWFSHVLICVDSHAILLIDGQHHKNQFYPIQYLSSMNSLSHLSKASQPARESTWNVNQFVCVSFWPFRSCVFTYIYSLVNAMQMLKRKKTMFPMQNCVLQSSLQSVVLCNASHDSNASIFQI